MKKYLIVFLISMVPLIELRGAIPYAVGFNLPMVPSYIVAVIGNMVCYVQLFLELRIEKQSYMLLCQAGFGGEAMGVTLQEHQAKKAELESLSRRIGKTGMWVLSPLIQDKI